MLRMWERVTDECPRGRWRETTERHAGGHLRHYTGPDGAVLCFDKGSAGLSAKLDLVKLELKPTEAQAFAEACVKAGLTSICRTCDTSGRDAYGETCSSCSGVGFTK